MTSTLPPLHGGGNSSMRRSMHGNPMVGQPQQQQQQQRPPRSHQLYLQRPGSVEGDLNMLSNLRRRMQQTHQLFDDLLQLEHKQRYRIEETLEQRWKSMMGLWAAGGAQVRYREELREKVKVQSALTEKVHALFEVSLQEEKSLKLKKKQDELARKKMKAQKIRNARPADQRGGPHAQRQHAARFALETTTPVLTTSSQEPLDRWGDDGSHTEGYWASYVTPEVEQRRALTQARREEDHHRRYASDISKKLTSAMRAASVREEEVAIRRERIVQKAVGLHENKKRVQDAHRAQSLTPTAFLQLPPLREVFADDVLVFDAPTLMSRHYHSTYRPSVADVVGGAPRPLMGSLSSTGDGGDRHRNDVSIGTD